MSGEDEAEDRDQRGSDILDTLLVRVADGDRAAFQILYTRSSAKLFGTCLRILQARDEAEEVLQDVYVSVWRRADSFRPERGRAMTWLITLARNRAIDRLRSRRPVSGEPLVLAEAVPDPAPLAHARMEAGQERGRLAACLKVLAVDDAAMLRVAFFEGASYSDLATRTATPLGTVKSRIRRALMRLRECLR